MDVPKFYKALNFVPKKVENTDWTYTIVQTSLSLF